MLRSTRALQWVGAALIVVPCTSNAQSLFAPGFQSPGVSDGVSTLAAFDPDGPGSAPAALYAGGEFAASANVLTSNLASWNGTTWSSVGSGTDGWVGALETFDADGTGPGLTALYLAGAFKTAGGTLVNHVAQWNGTTYQALGVGFDDWASALAVFDDDGSGPHTPALYAGGTFERSGSTSTRFIARWNGTAWTALGTGLEGPVAAMTVFNGALYVGGLFSTAGSTNVNNIARWTGTAWQAVGSGFDGPVQTLAVYDPDGTGPTAAALYAGGSFKMSGSTTLNGIARWTGSAWAQVGGGLTAPSAYPAIRSLRSIQDGSTWKLYATGLFKTAGTASAGTPVVPDAMGCGGLLVVATWNGTTWSTLGSGSASNANDMGRAVLSFDDDGNGTPSLFVGGHFSTTGANCAAGIARWDGTSWVSMGTGQGLGSSAAALAAPAAPLAGMSETVVAAGNFTSAGTTPVNRVALWNGTSWQPLGAGAGTVLNGPVRALHFEGANLVVGGAFTTAGASTVNRIARWSGPGAELLPLGAGVDGEVLALGSYQGLIIAGGSFQNAGGNPANCVAAWNEGTTSWSALGTGVQGAVRALTTFDDGSGSALYAGGEFDVAGTTAASSVARWNGTSWSALGDGLCCGSVNALVVFDDGTGPALYAGGSFDRSGEVDISGIARWNPATQAWVHVGGGVSGGRPPTVYSLTAWNGVLVAGGDFMTAGGISSPNLARWNGTTWSAFGAGSNNNVRALLVPGGSSTLFVGGDFTVIDGRAASRIARAQ
jgi:trimeric autotransporter adhesin